MKEEVSIKVKITDRVFPIKVSNVEEPHVRKAAKDIDQKVKEIQVNFGIKDYKDVLAMIALELGTENVRFKSKSWIEDDGVSEKLDELDEMLDILINESNT